VFTAISEHFFCWHLALTSFAVNASTIDGYFAAPWHAECVIEDGPIGVRPPSRGLLADLNTHLKLVAIVRKYDLFFHRQLRECFMLVLTRKYQEKIRIGNDITITVLRTKGKAVRLGIEAPAEVPVIRGELSFERPNDASLETEGVANPSAISTSHRGCIAGEKSSWQAVRDEQSRTQVELRRVPRDKVAEMLPRLVNDGGPLRSVMSRRTAV
jgi:carbon storage regulator CsrA